MRLFLQVIFLILSCVLFSCKKGKLKANTASYIVVNTTAVGSTTLSIPDSHKITDIWLYVDDKFQGIYPVGSVMPVVNDGTANVRMYGGIINNGIAGTRLPYIFYDPFDYSGTFEANKTYTITPKFYYKTGIQVQDDNFDGIGGSYYSPGGDNPPAPISDATKVWGGTGRSMFMTMTDTKPTSTLLTSTPMPLPVGGVDVYLEMDYKCNNEIVVGVSCGGGVEQRVALNLRTTNGEWKKVYVSLTNVISTQPTYNFYQVLIQASKSSDVASPEIYLDNLRLVRP